MIRPHVYAAIKSELKSEKYIYEMKSILFIEIQCLKN